MSMVLDAEDDATLLLFITLGSVYLWDFGGSNWIISFCRDGSIIYLIS